MDPSSDKLFCCRWVRNKVPRACRDELYHILRMTGPLLLSRILHYLLPFVVTMFCGRLGNDVMAGYGLASAAINVTTAATGCGLGLACDTLVSQTFGGKNLLRVGVILQRGIIILMLFCLPCWGLLINAEAILLCMGQEPEVARVAQLYMTAFIPAVPGIIMPQMYTALLANIANLATNFAFLHWANLGVVGSAAANTLSQIYICVFLFAYIWWRKLHVNTWGGWSVESLQEWGSYMKLAIPSLLMVCFEWWVYEFGGFFAAAACARVGNALGAGDTARALLASKLSLSLAVSFALVEGVVLGCTKTVIGYIFTSDENIARIVSNLMSAYCFLQLFDGLVVSRCTQSKSVCRTEAEVSRVRLLSSQCVCTGIFLGTGKQRIPAVANFIAYYCVGLTMSVVLMFVAKLRVLGFWLGLLICVVLHSSFYIIVIFRLNWKKMTEEAVKRAMKKTHLTLLGADDPSDNSTAHGQASNNGNSTKGYSPVKTQQHDGNSETRVEQEVRQQKSGRLSTTQLIIRRGLTMVTALAFLAVGTAVHFLVPLPEIGSNSTLDGINTTFPPLTNMEASSDRLFCCSWLRRRVPSPHREELYHILRMTGPLLLSRILSYLLPFVVTMFCGRLGNDVMAGYGLASATINVTTAATGYGLGLACDTLISQTFGGRNLLQVGVIFQRSVIILLLFCLPCWGLLINAQPVLLCVGQDPEVARYLTVVNMLHCVPIAQLYITAFLPAVPCLCHKAMFLHNLQVSYLQNQGIILPQLYTAAVANVANVATNYLLLHWLNLGVRGSAAANTLSQIYICSFLFAYIRWKRLHVKTWEGWSVESLQEWGSYMKLALPSTLMKCFEWWVYELGGFFAGMLSEDELAAQHAVIMIAFLTYMFPLGLQAATCARVGNALGAGDRARALLTSKVSLCLAATFAVVEGVVLGCSKTVIGYIFTSDQKIIGLVSHLMNAYCFLQFFDGLVVRRSSLSRSESKAACRLTYVSYLQGVCTGIFLGTGKQKIPAVANFVGYYCIGLTLSVTFMFVAKLRVLVVLFHTGFWLGLLVCVILQSTFYIIVIFRLNWEKVTEEAVKRAQKTTNMTLISASGLTDVEGTAAGQTAYNEKSADGYICVSTEDQDGHAESPGGREVGRTGGHLSTTQLIIRRGLAVFAAVALLAVGAVVHFLVPLPEFRSAEGNRTAAGRINATHPPDPIYSTVLVPNGQS
ncbi:hypothetical protein CCH79_00010301, partial [Gambusia affinis]